MTEMMTLTVLIPIHLMSESFKIYIDFGMFVKFSFNFSTASDDDSEDNSTEVAYEIEAEAATRPDSLVSQSSK
jgi:hypothetical protein